jgi:nitric oxide synthase-interacting protein
LSLVSQKNDIKRQKEKLEAMKREAEEERQRAREAARERVLLEFEKGQLSLAGSAATAATKNTPGANSSECEQILYLYLRF